MTHLLRPEDPRHIGGYRIEARLGTGGMGVVYLGVAPDGRQVAVKLVRAEFRDDVAFRSRFRREVEAAAMVRGRHVARLVAAAPDDADPWLATEYVPGPTLVAAVQEHGPRPEGEVRELAAGLVEALRAIHTAGLVHRDLKPANVILGPNGPTVIDLGVAHVGDATALTGTGLQIGTPMFMAPEQAVGSAVTAAVDIWGLGAIACFAATGTGPFGTGQPTALLYRVVHDAPQLDGCPPGLRSLVAACLAKDPAARPTLDQVAAGLATRSGQDLPFATAPTLPDAAADEATSIRTLGAPAPAAPGEKPRRRRLVLVAGIAAGLLLAGGVTTALVAGLPDDDGSQIIGGPASPFPSVTPTEQASTAKPKSSPTASPTASPTGGAAGSPTAAPAPATAPAPARTGPGPSAGTGGTEAGGTEAGGTGPGGAGTGGAGTDPAGSDPASPAPDPAGPKAWTKGALGIEVVQGGAAVVGSTLHITSSGWSPALVTGNTNCSWRWDDGTTVRSGTSSSCSYRVTEGDVGHRLVLYVSTHQDGYSGATGRSAPSAVVQAG